MIIIDKILKKKKIKCMLKQYIFLYFICVKEKVCEGKKYFLCLIIVLYRVKYNT